VCGFVIGFVFFHSKLAPCLPGYPAHLGVVDDMVLQLDLPFLLSGDDEAARPFTVLIAVASRTARPPLLNSHTPHFLLPASPVPPSCPLCLPVASGATTCARLLVLVLRIFAFFSVFVPFFAALSSVFIFLFRRVTCLA